MNERTNEPQTVNVSPFVEKVIPLEVPYKCVLCQGFGSFSHGKITCNGCKGLGYVMVKAKKEEAK